MKTPTIEEIDTALKQEIRYFENLEGDCLQHSKVCIFAIKLAKVVMGEPSEKMLENLQIACILKGSRKSNYKAMIEAAIEEA